MILIVRGWLGGGGQGGLTVILVSISLCSSVLTLKSSTRGGLNKFTLCNGLFVPNRSNNDIKQKKSGAINRHVSILETSSSLLVPEL